MKYDRFPTPGKTPQEPPPQEQLLQQEPLIDEVGAMPPVVETAPLEREGQQEREAQREFFEGMQREEQGTVGTILSKFTEVPKALKRGIMMLAAAGAILSTSEAFAGDAFAKNYKGW